MGQQSGATPPDQLARGDRLALAIRTLSAPRAYVRPWYIAYLLLGMVTAGVLPVLLPLTIEALSHRLATVAYVVGAYNLGLLTSPLWGALAERRKLYRQLFLGSFLLTALAIAALPVSRALAGWMAAAFAIGAGSGGAATLATLFVIDFTPRPEWEPRIGWLQSFNASGQVAGLLLAAAFSDGRWTEGLWSAAAILLPAVLVGGIGLPLSRTAQLAKASRQHVHAHLDIRALSIFPRVNLPSGVAVHLYHLNWQGLRRLPQAVGTPFGRFLLSWFVLAFSVAALFSYFPLMLADSYAIAAHLSATIYAVAAALSIGLYVLTSRLAARHGASRIYRAGLTVRIGGFALLMAPFVISMADRESTLLGAAGFVLIVLTWPLLSVSGTDLAARLTPFSEGAAVGLLNAALALATAIGTIISGPLIRRWGYGTIPATALAGLVVSLLLQAAGTPRR
jgi:MFS family permease